MPLARKVGLDPSDIVLMGIQLPSPKRWQSPPFSAHVYCAQTAAWIKMPLGMEVGLGPGHIVLDGDPAPPPKKGAQTPNFSPCLLWPNSWMDQDAKRSPILATAEHVSWFLHDGHNSTIEAVLAGQDLKSEL